MSTPVSSAKKRKARSATVENGREKGPPVAIGSTIVVALRVRPFIDDEDKDSVIRVKTNQVAVLNGEDEIVFKFSYVFGMDSNLDALYSKTASSLVTQAVDGYNVCIMAYGQTGSGKTYCMSGSMAESGVIPRFCIDLFDKAAARDDPDQKFAVSFYEIYQEKAYDLLSDGHVPLRVRGGDDVYLQDLTVCCINSFEELEKLRRTAWTKRATEATAMNRCSSRSHVFMQLTYSHLESNLQELGDYVNRVRSNIYFVDLAGSERLSEVGYSYLDETVSINSSLSALHRVIFSAGTRLKPSYRDSLLTRLLKDCLGGNARTLLIANITPSSAHRSETVSTLRFASRAATVKQCAVKNIDPVVTALLDLKQENKALKTRIEQLETSQKLVSFDLPSAPSIVEFQSDASLTTWEPLVGELSFSAFGCDSTVVIFSLRSGVVNIISHEEGVFVNGEYLYPNIPSRGEHGDRVVVRGERFFFVYTDPCGMEEFLGCSYHSIKAEYLEKNMERFRAEVLEIERNRRRSDSDKVAQALVEQIKTLEAALSNKKDQKAKSNAKEREILKIELENCMALKETFLDLCKREISAFGIKFDSFAELFEIYSLKRDVETANFVLSNFNKESVYSFEMLLPEADEDTLSVRVFDYKNKMFGDLGRADFDSVLRRLKDYHQQFIVPENGYETVGQFMFKLCRRKLQMSRIGGTRMSNFVKTALFNSTVDAAKKRRTTLKDFRLSIGGSKRKSTFTSNFAIALGDLPECENTFKTQFLQRLGDMCCLREADYKRDFVESMWKSLVELKTQLLDVRAIQRGAIREGIGFFAVLCKLIALVNKIDGSVETALGFSHPLCVECCMNSVSSVWRSFVEFFSSWISLLGNSEAEETFEEVGPMCLEGMSNVVNALVIELGKLALFVGGKLPEDSSFQEIKEAFVNGSREAINEIKEEAEDVILRMRGKIGVSSDIAIKTAQALILACEEVSSNGNEKDMYEVISPMFGIIQLSSIVTPIECLMAEREYARKSCTQLRLVADAIANAPAILALIKDAMASCERTMIEENIKCVSAVTISSEL